MRTTLSIAALALATRCAAFTNTSPLLAWSSASPSDRHSPLIINAPGLRTSDLADLDRASAIRAAFDAAHTDSRLHLPYVEPGKNPLDVLYDRLPCQREVQPEILTLKDFEGVHVDRRRALRTLDDLVSQQTDVFDGSRLVAIISHAGPVLHKRQGIDYRPTLPTISPLQDDDDDDDDDGGEKGGNGGNSTWKPDPNAPALAKYTITNPIQILTVLILVLIILPAIVYTISMLTDISLPYGLESGKMGGGPSDKQKKDQ